MTEVFKPGLYAITPQRFPDARRLIREVRLALEGGAAMVQFRDKSSDADWRRATAESLKAACDDFGVPLIINDDIQLAAAVEAAGVHLGAEDGPAGPARALLRATAMIGISCYDSLDRARAAAMEADYLAFGSVFPSATKPGAVRCPLEKLGRARALGLPVVAIGGITPENGRAAIEAGADSLAIIGALFDHPDILGTAQSFAALWDD